MTNKHTPTGPKYIYQETVDTLCSQSCVYVSRREGKMRSRLKTAGGGEKKGRWGTGGTGGGCQYTPWAEKMSKTYMRETQGDTGLFLHGTVPSRSMENSLWSTLLQSHSVWCWIATCCGRWLLRHERWGRAQCAFVDEKLMICANCEGKLMCLCKVVCFAGVDTCPRWQRSIFHMEINAKLFQKSCFCWTTVGWKIGR